MLICRNFIVLNLPKTGSTFVRTVIKDIYRRREDSFVGKTKKFLGYSNSSYMELILPNIKAKGRPDDHHGTYSQIPKEYLNRKIISVIRNPFEKFLSTFEYKWWVDYPPLKKDLLYQKFPHFPNLSLDDFVDLNILSVKQKLNDENKYNIGNQTIQFIQMFFKNPEEVFSSRLNNNYLDVNDDYKNDIAKIEFLKQENLNTELSLFLLNNGFSRSEALYCENFKRINETSKFYDNRFKLWSPKSISYVEENERFLFRILNDLGYKYCKPIL